MITLLFLILVLVTTSLGPDPYLPKLHFSGQQAWINDPIPYYNTDPDTGTPYYHLFYQRNPYSCEWQAPFWGHAYSTDLVHWTDLEFALEPKPALDNDGAWTGSVVFDSAINAPRIIYTCVEEGVQRQCQATLAVDANTVLLDKWVDDDPSLNNPVAVPPSYIPVDKFRDPYPLTNLAEQSPDLDTLQFMTVGSGNGTPAILTLVLDDTAQWKTLRTPLLTHTPDTELGYNWECPSWLPLLETGPTTSRGVFFIGVDTPFYTSRYLIADLDLYPVPQLTAVHGDGGSGSEALWGWQDRGVLYAGTQIQAQEGDADEGGRRLYFGWIKEERPLGTEEQCFSGVIAFPRTIGSKWVDTDLTGLIWAPVVEVDSLFESVVYQQDVVLSGDHVIEFEGALDVFDMQISTSDVSSFTVVFIEDSTGLNCSVRVDGQAKTVVVERQHSTIYDQVLNDITVPVVLDDITGIVNIRLIVDVSVAELFVNDSEVASFRFYLNLESLLPQIRLYSPEEDTTLSMNISVPTAD